MRSDSNAWGEELELRAAARTGLKILIISKKENPKKTRDVVYSENPQGESNAVDAAVELSQRECDKDSNVADFSSQTEILLPVKT
ncbi:hypothetical protein YC2023_038596 [Brassica napus]